MTSRRLAEWDLRYKECEFGDAHNNKWFYVLNNNMTSGHQWITIVLLLSSVKCAVYSNSKQVCVTDQYIFFQCISYGNVFLIATTTIQDDNHDNANSTQMNVHVMKFRDNIGFICKIWVAPYLENGWPNRKNNITAAPKPLCDKSIRLYMSR